MMDVNIQNISKRFQYHWVLKNISQHFSANKTFGISGQNGSGKSTLLKIIAGYLSYTKGEINYTINNKSIDRSEIYQYLSIAAPYIQLDEEFTPLELFHHYSKFKSFSIESDDAFLAQLGFQDNTKLIKYFSSGMKQKVMLLLALMNDAPLLLLDEPTSYLDDANKEWFITLLKRLQGKKTIIIASNDMFDFKFCTSIYAL